MCIILWNDETKQLEVTESNCLNCYLLNTNICKGKEKAEQLKLF